MLVGRARGFLLFSRFKKKKNKNQHFLQGEIQISASFMFHPKVVSNARGHCSLYTFLWRRTQSVSAAVHAFPQRHHKSETAGCLCL